MSGYRCVNYYELCRLCTTSNGNKVNIFSEENKRKNLSSKIIDVLPVLHLDEKDKLPKIICTQCLQNIENYADFRETSINAQNMLQSCLNSTKLCNGGQVYIKDAAVKKAVSAPQTLTITSPLKNEISLTPISNNNTATLMTPSSDFLSTIMQAVGIQQSEENDNQTKMAATQQLTSGQNTQFRITFDTNSVKNGNQVQYKIQQEQPTTSFIATTAPSASNEQNQTTLAQVNEFLKLKATPNVAPKRPEVTKPRPEPKLKKPKMQILTTPVKTPAKPVQQQHQQTPPQQQQQQQQIQIQKAVKSTTIAMPIKSQVQTLTHQTSPMKSTPLQIQDIKFVSAANKCMVPLVLKNSNDATQQLFTQFAASSETKPVAYLQMKIEPNSDGQPCVQLTPTQMPATLQLTQQQLQQFGFQQFQPAQIQAQPSQNNTTQQFQVFSPQTITTPVTMATTTTLQTNTTASQTQTLDEPDDGDDDCGDDALMEVGQMDTSDEVEEVKPRVEKPAASTRKKNSPVSVQPNTPTSSASSRSYSTLSQIPKHQSDLATRQLEVISLHKDLTTPAKAMVVNDNQEPVEETYSLTKCQVCGKEFKKKEHCMQHLKTHIGLRPFVCQDKSGCNKSFNRKEHLLRHVVSHTGKKMFNCDLCHKYFSRKDNLNKHRRTHPEACAVANALPYQCEMCERSFVAKSQYLKHKASHENQSNDDKDDDEPPPPPPINVSKAPKNQKTSKPVAVRKLKQEPTETRTEEHQPQEQQLQQSQPPALQIIKQQQQPSQHTTTNTQMTSQMHPQIIQILPSMMSTSNAQTITINQQDQQQKTTIIKTLNADGNTTVYTIPSNLILNPAQFMTAGEMMGSFKIENAN